MQFDSHINDIYYNEERRMYLRRKFSRISLAFVICIFVTYLAVYAIQTVVYLLGFGKNLSENIYWQWVISLLPLYLFGVPAIFLFVRKTEILPPKKKRLPIGEFLLLFLIGRFFTLAGTYISNFLIGITETFLKSPITDATSELISSTPAWLTFISAVIIAPIVEELIYRKIIIDRIYAHGEWIAILFSSIIFALAHGNLYQVAYAFLNGCILGLLYIRTGHLRYSIAFHMLTNFLGSIVILPIIDAQTKLEAMIMAENMNAEYITLSMLIGGYSITKIFLALLGAVVLCVCYKQYIPKKQAIDPIPRVFVLHTVAVNPGFIAFLVVSAFEFIMSFY